MGKVFVFLAEGFEEIEALTVVDMLRREKIETEMVSIMGERSVTGSHNITVIADGVFEGMSFAQGDMLVLPGGLRGMENLKKHEGLRSLLLDYADQKKWIAAICAAPVVLGSCGLLNGRHATCYPGHEEGLTGAVCLEDAVVRDGFFITSRGMGTSVLFAAALIGCLRSEEDAAELLKKIIYVK